MISEEEINILLVPDKPWRTGVYQLNIDPRLKDLAGNNLERLFDEDVIRKSKSSVGSLKFVVR